MPRKVKEGKLVKYQPDTVEHIQRSDLIQLSRDLLQASVDSSNFLSCKELTPAKLKEAKVVLGFLNATNNVIKTKMQFFKMVGMKEKIAAVEKRSKLMMK